MLQQFILLISSFVIFIISDKVFLQTEKKLATIIFKNSIKQLAFSYLISFSFI